MKICMLLCDNTEDDVDSIRNIIDSPSELVPTTTWYQLDANLLASWLKIGAKLVQPTWDKFPQHHMIHMTPAEDP